MFYQLPYITPQCAYAIALAVTSAFTLARFLKTFLVFAQTFILRGKRVCLTRLHLWVSSDACISAQDVWCRKRCWAGSSHQFPPYKEFALQLASAGFNILVARNQVMLSNVADEIGTSVPDPSHIGHISHVSSTRVKPSGPLERSKLIGFVKNDPDTLRELKTLLRSLDIGILGMYSKCNVSIGVDLMHIYSQQCGQVPRDADILRRHY